MYPNESTPFTCRFQASSDLERKEWLDTMTTAILTGLDTRPQTINRGGQNTTSQVCACVCVCVCVCAYMHVYIVKETQSNNYEIEVLY